MKLIRVIYCCGLMFFTGSALALSCPKVSDFKQNAEFYFVPAGWCIGDNKLTTTECKNKIRKEKVQKFMAGFYTTSGIGHLKQRLICYYSKSAKFTVYSKIKFTLIAVPSNGWTCWGDPSGTRCGGIGWHCGSKDPASCALSIAIIPPGS